ncbi:MupA/Atu3671 family FMN-dependent luciferase-like monooxygenase [Streptomyces sp. NPDC005209]|uniref:MupA/Atu3671 family FMN-dependent luciferase-like monooxygenase n=1 Tax=Streptomyces sp. NPDC005209 TaxID=3156715 RepID=UPI0033AC880A
MTGVSASIDQDLAAMADLSSRIARQMGQQAPAPVPEESPRMHGPRVTVSRGSGMVRDASGRSAQEAHLKDLVRRYTARTRRSKEIAARHHPVLADSRAVVGFRSSTKEMLYPLAGRRAFGARLEDVDGNQYVDITMGFGVLLFGHEPAFVTEAVREHLSRGIQLGPRAVETGETAELLAELTGLERVAFACSGTEANSGAIRLARAATGRDLIVTFHGAYHGHADNVLGRSSGSGEDRVTVPVSSGIPRGAVRDLLVLDYGDPGALETIELFADRIAAVVVEPVQSRHPALRPAEFVRGLREVTRRHGIVLMFDEMLTGFRPAPRGAQELYGVTPDLATYGKVLGGGFPVGAIAGRADIMDGVDGGLWRYGDDSYPPADTTFFGGTYLQHPVSMVAAKAVLTHLKENSPGLQQRLNARTDAMADTLNRFFEDEEFPLRVSHFGSQFRFEHRADMELLYHHLILRGVHVWEWRNFFLSSAHTDADIEVIVHAVQDSLRELRRSGFFPTTGPTATPGPGRTDGVHASAQAATPGPAQANGVHAPAQAATPGPGRTNGVHAPVRAATPGAAQANGVHAPVQGATPVPGRTNGAHPSAQAATPGPAQANGADTPARAAVPASAGASGVHAPAQASAPAPAPAARPPAPESAPSAVPAADAPAPIPRMAWNTVASRAHAPARSADAPIPAQAPSRAPAEAGLASVSLAPAPVRPRTPRKAPDFSVYFFGDYPDTEPGHAGGYELLMETARFADAHGFHALWMPERHFHSFGGLFPNPAVLASALARETRRIRLNAGSVVLPLHDPIRVAEEWSMVDNLSGGRIGIGCASGWHANDFVFFPDRFGRHKELMYEQLEDVRRLWHGGALRRASGDGEADVRLFPRPVQDTPPMYTAVVGNPASYELAARHDLGVVTNLMAQSVEQLAENVARYRRTRAEHGLDPDAGRVAVLLHTYLGPDHRTARAEAYEPLARYMRASLSLFGSVTNSLGYNVDLSRLSEDDLDTLFRRAYDRYCDQRALIGTVDTVSPVVEAVTAAGADEIVSLVDFGVAPDALRASLVHVDGLRRHHQERRPTRTVRPERPADDPGAPLSPGQQRLWFLWRMFPDHTGYNEVKAIRLDGPLDPEALRAALRALVARHAGLRTVFREVAGEPRQFVLPPAEPDFAVIDRADGEAALREVLTGESERRFDLADGPLLVARLVRQGDERHVLVLSMHHIVSDAESATILSRDLSAFYRAEREGTTPDLPALTRTYVDHVRDQLAAQDSPKAAADLAYWREALKGDLPVSALPHDRPRPATMTSRGRAVFHTLDGELSDQLRELSRRQRSTLFMTLLAGYAAALHRTTGQDDLVIGTPASHRPSDAADVIGFYLNTLALRLDLSGDPDFGALLARVRSVALDAYDHADVPFETVVHDLAPRRTTAHTPVFQVIAEYEKGEAFRFDLPGVRATPLDFGPEKSLTDLSVYFTDLPAGIRCQLEYSTDLFDADTIDRFFATFRDLLRAAVRDPKTPLSELAASPEPVELSQPAAPVAAGTAVPADWRQGPSRPVEPVTVAELVARRAAADPDRPAVEGAGSSLTYRELEERAERLARALRARGTAPGSPVAVWLPRSPDLVVALYGVLKAGHPYVPLDPSLGRPRAEAVIVESGARTLVTVGAPAGLPALPDGTTVLDLAALPDAAPAPGDAADPESPCYVIYTSGSTGTPKGVVVPHRAVVDVCQWHHRRFSFTADDRSALVCSPGFDASVLELWPALTVGACVVVPDDAVRRDALTLARWYTNKRVAFSILPTALGEAVVDLPVADQPSLRHLVVGGDVLRTHPRPGTPYELVNVYGPTEVTVLCTAHTVPAAEPGTGAEPIPIGRPVDNVRLHVLDEDGAPVPVGATGELYVGGPGLSDGYLRRPGSTGERFQRMPLAGGAAERLYRTGDLVRWTGTGILEFVGRTDDQVKVRGFRVEPEEVTRALSALPGVREAIVLGRRDARGEARLVAHVVPAEPLGDGAADRQTFVDRLARELIARLPEYLVPRAWAVLHALPLSGTGKVDRTALPDPEHVTAPPVARAARTEAGAPHDGAPRGDVPRGDAPRGAGRSATESRLRELWADEFGVPADTIGADADFFALGGHSITAIRLINRVREAFGADYPMTLFYEESTLRAMADHLAGAEDGPHGEEVRRAPVTLQQKGFITGHSHHRVPQVFNVAMRIALTGDLDVTALRTALSGLVARHEALRTRFAGADDEWWQEVLPARPVDLPVEDFTGRPQEAERVVTEVAQTPYDLAETVEPVFRLLRTGASEWVLLFVLHHSTCDGWAVSVLLHDFAALYAAAVTGTPHALREPAPQPTEYVHWQRENAPSQAERRKKAAYWGRELAGAPFRLETPLDRPRPEELSGQGDVVLFTVPADVRGEVERFAKRRGTTAYAVTAAAVGKLLCGLSGRPDVLLNVPYANRQRREFESLVACTASSYPLRVRAGEAADFGALVDRVSRSAVGGIDHIMPMWELAAMLREEGGDMPDRIPVGYHFQSSVQADIELPGLDVGIEDLAIPAARGEFGLGLVPTGDVFAGYIEYSTDLWDRETIERWAERYVELLAHEVRTALRD